MYKRHRLPTALGQLVGLRQMRNIDTDHGLAQTLAHLSQDLGVLEVSHSLDNGLGALLGITGLEDARADEDTVAAQLHHERRVGGRGNTTGGEVDHGETALLGGLAQKLVRDLQLAGVGTELGLGVGRGLQDGASTSNVGVDGAHVLDSLHNITGTSLTLCTDHSGAFGDTAESLAQVTATADEGDLEAVLGNVVDIVGGGKDLGFVNVVDANGFEDLTA